MSETNEIPEGFRIEDHREGAQGVFTWSQVNDEGEPLDVAYELLGEARKLADKLGTFLATIVIGYNVKNHLEKLIHHGADKVFFVDDKRLQYPQVLPFTSIIEELIKQEKPEIFLFSATTFGREIAPRVAARIDVGLSADCTAFEIGDYVNRRNKVVFKNVLRMIRPSFGETKLATILGPWKFPQMATGRPGIFKPLPPDPSRKGETIEFTPTITDDLFKVKLVHTEKEQSDEIVDLKGAKIIVSGGKGVGAEGFPLLRELVEAIRANGQKAELGASRAAVEHGYISSKHQVGQTGTTVRPDIYIAIGISGAIQHIAGMKESKIIIAINKDREAKIFNYANYGIVGDYRDVVPILLEKVKQGYLFPIE